MLRPAVSCSLALVCSLAWSVAAQAQPVTVAWDRNPESTVIGYKVHIGTAPSVYSQTIDVGNVTQFTFSTGVAGRRYFFAVSAYAAGPLDGPLSTEVTTVIAGTTSGGSTSGGSTGGGSTGGGSTGGGGTTGGGSSGGGTSSGGGDSDSGSTTGGGTTGSGTTTGGGTTTTTGVGTTGGDDASESDPISPSGDPTPTGHAVVLDPAVVSGHLVSLSWHPVGGLQAAEYVLEAGSATGLSNVYNGSVGPVTTLSAQVTEGVYYVRVRGRTLSGDTTPPSNEVTVAVGSGGVAACTAAPAAPTSVSGRVIGTLASASWAPAGGATSYIVQAGSTPGLSDVFYGDVGLVTAVSAEVSPGFSAYVRVIAVNACGQSGASQEILVQ